MCSSLVPKPHPLKRVWWLVSASLVVPSQQYSCSESILLTWHNQENAQWSLDPFPHEKMGSGHETTCAADYSLWLLKYMYMEKESQMAHKPILLFDSSISPERPACVVSFPDLHYLQSLVIASLVPRLPCTETRICGESLVSFLTWSWHNWKGPEFRTEGQRFTHCSSNYTFKALYVGYLALASYMYICEVSHLLPLFFLLFWVFGYTHTQLRSLCPLSTCTFNGAHVRKNTRLFPPAQLQCSHSGAGEPGNEARKLLCLYTLCLLHFMYMTGLYPLIPLSAFILQAELEWLHNQLTLVAD